MDHREREARNDFIQTLNKDYRKQRPAEFNVFRKAMCLETSARHLIESIHEIAEPEFAYLEGYFYQMESLLQTFHTTMEEFIYAYKQQVHYSKQQEIQVKKLLLFCKQCNKIFEGVDGEAFCETCSAE